ncbi:DNA methyltransferase, partial [Brachybacterium sp. AOP42-E1-35]|uniref:DNA methyltransferase n=1 Tax=Brachybacterium sp. AOP42-E1-35 TaxID=3457664 RepID=UPI00402AE453
MAAAAHSYDSLFNGEEFISEHFFTSGATTQSFHAAVLRLRKQWDADDGSSLREMFLADRAAWESQLGALFSDPDAPPAPDDVAATAATTRAHLGFASETSTWVTARGEAELVVPGVVWQEAVLLLEATPVSSVDDLFSSTSRPLGEVTQDGKPFDRSLPKLVSEIFAAEDHPEWVMVLAGQWVLLTQRDRWAEGRYLAVDLLLAVQRAHVRKGGELDRVLAILGRDSLLPEADGTRWWDGVLEDSGEHAVGVSKDLREGIRSSIEIIANDVLVRRAARGLPLEEIDAQDLARQSLRFLYRILFLLFAEARPDMGLVPAGADEYEEGYGLARLRELVLVDMTAPRALRGTHLYESLEMLFELVRTGHQPTEVADANPSLRFDALEADLFSSEATPLIDEAKLSNRAAQQMLQHLLLTPEGSGDRGFISYAELGVNQLGAVYEGLMSYTGFFAEEDLYEVAPKGDTSKGSWTVPASRADRLDLSPDDFVLDTDQITCERHTRIHPKGSFVFRLAGRERQQSASYYTPEVLTRFVVSQALEELLDQDDMRTSAEEILQLTVCEPALGSGAFAIEAVRQLAAEYLTRRQEELDQQIPAEEMPVELAKVKAHIALHQVYGVDLNATAVELAEVSLWLDTMVPGLNAPWFGLRLRRGNSLIGAQRATFHRDQVADKAKGYLTGRPTNRSLEADRSGLNGQIFHFLLPHEGWGAATGAKKSARDLAPEATSTLKTWQREMRKRLTSSATAKDWAKYKQLERLQDVSQRVDVLWDFVVERMELAESEAQRDLDFFGTPLKPTGNGVGRAEIERKLADPSSAYRRLRRIMDAWCALWFWPLTEAEIEPPSIDEWIDALTRLLGRSHGQQDHLVPSASAWEELNAREDLDLRLNGAEPIVKVLEAHPWLKVTERIATEQGFFHWELDFATVFRRGGFDLQVGNPPWVRPDVDEKALFAEFDPSWKISTTNRARQPNHRTEEALKLPGASASYLEQHASLSSTRAFLSSKAMYPLLTGLRTDLYRCFMNAAWKYASENGIIALLHPETHLIDIKGGQLRDATYRRLRRFWQFDNNSSLFKDVDDHVKFAVNIYGQERDPRFLIASSLRTPTTVTGSLIHDGSGEIPGVKDDHGKWDSRPHKMRISAVTTDTLSDWARLIEPPGTPATHSRVVYTINAPSARLLQKMAIETRLGDLEMLFSSGWNETTDRQNETFVEASRVNRESKLVIMQGRHIGVSNPLSKQPNEPLASKSDWGTIDHEAIGANFIPRTLYQPNLNADFGYPEYKSSYSAWNLEGGPELSAIDCYRMAWRSMANLTSMRTLHVALIPPGPAHPNGVFSMAPRGSQDLRDLIYATGVASSLTSDFFIRSTAGSAVSPTLIRALPLPNKGTRLEEEVVHRTLLLNCLTSDYAEIYTNVSGEAWDPSAPLRKPEDRRRAL